MAADEKRSDAEELVVRQSVVLRRLKLALFAAITIPSFLLIAGALHERAQLLRSAVDDAVTAVVALREHAVKTIETDEFLIRHIDRRTEGMSWDQIKASSGALSTEIAAMQPGMPEVLGMAITDSEGRWQAGTNPEDRNETIASLADGRWNAERDIDRGTFIGHRHVSALSGRQNFELSRRRATPDGRFEGIIHVGVASAYFMDFWAKATAGRADPVIALVRLDGEVLARLPPPDASPDGGNVPDGIVPVGMLAADGAASDGTAAERAAAEGAAAEGVAAEGVVGGRGGVFRTSEQPRGIDRIYVWSRIGDYPLAISYSIGVASAMAPWRRHLIETGGVAVLSTVALVLAVLAGMRQARRLMAEQDRRLTTEQAAPEGERLEVLGRLTAGFAHDFANILQVLDVSASQFRRAAGHPDRVRSLADRLAKDVERGMWLTQRILDQVRRKNEVGAPDTHGPSGGSGAIDPAEALSRLAEVLPRLLGRNHRLRWDASCQLPACVRGNQADLEMAMMNLVVNARDAMPGGGEIVVRATPARFDDPKSPAGLAPGLYLRVAVTDSGVGMSAEVRARAGAPFFTTKQRERGTGLGLAGARGFAERSGGMLQIESEVGIGTTVTLWLPAIMPLHASQAKPVQPVGS